MGLKGLLDKMQVGRLAEIKASRVFAPNPSDTKKMEKYEKWKKEAAVSGLSALQASKMYPASLRVLGRSLEMPRLPINLLLHLPRYKTTVLRQAFDGLEAEHRNNIREMVLKVHTKGYIVEDSAGYTEVQKKKVLKAMTPKFDAKAEKKSGLPFSELKKRHGRLFETIRYNKKNVGMKDADIIDIFGQNISKYYTDSFREAIVKGLKKGERKEILKTLEQIAPANVNENARIRRLISLLS